MTTPDTRETLPELWARIGDSAGAAALALFDRLRAAGATDDELRRALSLLVAAQNTHAGATGEALARAQLTAWDAATEAVPVPVSEVSTHLDRDRLGRAVGTVLERIDPADLAVTAAAAGTALHRLARSEAVTTGQDAYRFTMTEADSVGSWSRDLEPDACELCIYWYASGREWTKHRTMPTHTGCVCAQQFHRA